MTDFRALCEELVDDLELSDWPSKLKDVFRADIARARAALAEQPVGPTDEEIRTLAAFDVDFDCFETTDESGNVGNAWECSDSQLLDFARAALARWGCPTAQPVAVSERLPGPEDCTAQGWCWVFYKGFATWTLEPPLGQDGKHTGYTHWLPANALPIPDDTNDQ